MQLIDPTSEQLQAALDDPAIYQIDIYGDSFLNKTTSKGCIRLRGQHHRTVNLYGRLKLEPIVNYVGDTHIFYSETVDNPANITLNGGILDGQMVQDDGSPGSSGNEQMHGLNGVNGNNFHFNGVVFQNFKGDGAKVLGNGPNGELCQDVWFRNCIFRNNGRSGVTMQRRARDIHIDNCKFTNNKDQSIDFEPTGVTNIEERPSNIFITNAVIDHFTHAHALTISNSNRVFIDNMVVWNGSIQAVNALNLSMRNVWIYSQPQFEEKTARPAVDFLRDVRDLTMDNVHVIQQADSLVVKFSLNNGVAPDNIIWRGGRVEQPYQRNGVNMTAANNVTFDGVMFDGPGLNNAINADMTNGNAEGLAVRNCRFNNWDNGVRVVGGSVCILHNTGNRFNGVTNHIATASGGTVINHIEGFNG